MRTLIIVLSWFFLTTVCYTQPIQTNKNNYLKVNLSAFATKGIGLQYERKISHRVSAAIGYQVIPKANIAFQSSIKNMVEDPDIQVGDIRFGSSSVTPEVRYYLGKNGAFHGFYLAPYARISKYDMTVPMNTDGPSSRTIQLNGKLNNVTGGLLIGCNFQLSKTVYLDWWIIGASIGSATGSLLTTTQLSEPEQDALRDKFATLDVPFTRIKYDVHSNGADVATSGTIAGLRGLGVNVGVRF